MKRISAGIIFSALSGVISAAALFVMCRFPEPVIFLSTVFVWWLLIIGAYWFFSFEKKHLFLHLATSITFVSLMSLVEWQPLVVLLIVLAIPLFGFVWHWVAEKSRHQTSLSYKSWRRVIMMLWVLNMYGWMTGLFSLLIFFQNISRVLVSILGACFAAAVAAMVWHVYFEAEIKTFGFWMAIVALLVFEIIWVLYYLPLGYFTLGFVATWLWYLIHLFIRFRLTRGGIIWEKQRLFLGINVCLFTFILYIARWV